jgi:hypothetical protein
VKSLIDQAVTRFKNNDGVFTHSFENAAGWESPGRYGTGIEKESQTSATPFRNARILAGSKNYECANALIGDSITV